jgi:hypothetical protein
MRLAFASLAEHALDRGTTNPCGLFVYLLKIGRFDAITLRDEAVVRLKGHRRNRSQMAVCLREGEIGEEAAENRRRRDDVADIAVNVDEHRTLDSRRTKFHIRL